MQQKNRKSLENELYIFQRDDVKSTDRWYCAFKLQGVPRIYKALGVMSEQEAAKLARRALTKAEEQLQVHGVSAVLGKTRIADATTWFRKNAHTLLSETRYKQVLRDWDNHLSKFFGAKTAIDKRLHDRMSKYVEYRRRVINKRTGKRLQAKASTIKMEIISAKQLLKMARESAGIGEDVGNLSIGIRKSKLIQLKSSSTTFQDHELDEIRECFDKDADEIQKEIGVSSASGRTANRRLFNLERFRFLVAIAFATGCRLNEARQIRHEDLSDNFKTLRIRKSKTQAGTNRIAYIDHQIWDVRKAYNRYLTFSKTKKPKSLVFADEEGNVKQQEPRVLLSAGASFARFLKKHRMLYDKKFGKRRRNLFSTRHYWITRQVNDGIGSFDVARSAGTSLKMIEATYYEQDAATTVSNIERQKAQGRKGALKLVK
jgi:integrase